MINHLRTLLLNDVPSSEDHEEFVPPNFAPLPLIGGEASVQRCMVPSAFPRRTRNFLASIGLKLARTSPFYSAVEAVDPRLALLDIPVTTMLPTTTVTRLSGGSEVRVIGSLSARPGRGLFKRSWRLQKETNTSIEVVEIPQSERTSLDLTFNGDATSLAPIGDSGIMIQIVGASIVPAFQMEISAETPIELDLTTVLSTMRGDTSIVGVFALADKTLGNEMLQEFLHSNRPDSALAAALIGFTLHVTERLGL